MDPASKKFKNLLFFLLKFIISASLLYLLISKVEIETILQNLKLLNPLAFVFTAGLYVFSIYISSIRWSLLINQTIKLRRLFSMYMMGSFFNICLPGIIGGDALKAYYLSRELKDIKATPFMQKVSKADELDTNITAIASIFMDRYIGFSALLTVGIIAFPFGLSYTERDSNGNLLIWLMPIIFFLFVFISLVIFRFKLGVNFRLITKIYEYFAIYSFKKTALIKAFIYSVIIQAIGLFSVYILSKSMSFDIPLFSIMIFIPIIIVITLLPISISGIGLREFAFIFFFSSVGVSPEASTAISISWFFSVVIGSLWGLFEYLIFKTKGRSPYF